MPGACVTGASSGVGAAVAQKLAADGFDLVLTARRGDRLEVLRAQLEAAFPVRAHPFAADLRDGEAVRELARAARAALPDVSVLVLAAGHGQGQGRAGSGSAELLLASVETNLLGPARLVDELLPDLIAGGAGTIVAIGSTYALGGANPQWAGYAAAKHALRSYAASLRARVAEHGVRVCMVHPGSINTEFAALVNGSDAQVLDLDLWPYHPLLAEDVAEAVRWIVASPQRVNVSELVIEPREEVR